MAKKKKAKRKPVAAKKAARKATTKAGLKSNPARKSTAGKQSVKTTKVQSGPRRQKRPRDIEKVYTTAQFADKLRRFADSLEKGDPFRIQIANEQILVPVNATFSVEHERSKDEEEIEFQLKWYL